MKIHKKKFKVESLIILMFSILPIIDSINGYLVTEKKHSVGIFYKILVLLTLTFIILIKPGKISKKDLKVTILSIMFIFFSVWTNIILGGKIISMDFPIKLVFNILTFMMLMQLVKQDLVNGITFYKIFDIATIFMIACILIPYLLNMGYSIYGGNIGYKGFFYSQNELTAILLILLYFSFYNLICNFSVKSLIQAGGIFLSIILTNTKSSMVACAIGAVVFLAEYLNRKESKYKLLVISLIVVMATTTSGFVERQVVRFITRQVTLSNTYKKSIVATITSGRSFYVMDAWENLINDHFVGLKILIGNGFCSKILVEMDFLDMFFFLGFIGVMGYVSFCLWVYMKSKKNYRSDHTIIRKIGFLIVPAYSFLTGHIAFYATSGCYFIILCLFDMYYKTQGRDKINDLF